MRSLIAVAVLVAAGPAHAQPADGWAKKMFAKDGVAQTEHDFGTVPRGTLLNHRFALTNIYAVPMRVTDVRTSCGCVTVTAPPGDIQPHQPAALDVVMNARNFSGPKEVTIHVTVGPQYVSTTTLKVKANSRTDVVLNPGGVNFGVIAQGQTPEQTIDVEYAGPFAWQVTGHVAPPDAAFDVVDLQPFANKPGQVGYRVKVRLKPSAEAGVHKKEFHLRTNDPSSPLVPVLVEAKVQAPLAVLPASVSFDKVPVGQTVTQRVIVRSNNRPFRIVSADGQTDELTVAAPPDPRPSQIVVITYKPLRPGELRGQLVFRTDLDGQAVAVAVNGGAVAPQ